MMWSWRLFGSLLAFFCPVVLAIGLSGCGGSDANDSNGCMDSDESSEQALAEPGSTSVGGQGSELPRVYLAPFLDAAVSIDGEISPAEWSEAPWSEDFVDIEGLAQPLPAHRTRMKMAWDATHLYIAAELVEPHLWSEMTVHDSVIWHEDDFEVFIDPDGDRREYYEVEINARGTVFDLLLEKTYIDGGPALHDWTLVGLQHGIKIDGTLNDNRDSDRGWSVELALPWSSLVERSNRPSPPNSGDRWRMNFSRVDWPLQDSGIGYAKVEGERENNWVWSPQGKINMHLPEHWGFVQFDR